MTGVDTLALERLCYKLAELYGSDTQLVRLIKQAARTGDPAIAARAYDQLATLPARDRAALASWLAAGRSPVNDR